MRPWAVILYFSITIVINPLDLKAQSSDYHVQFFDEASGINAGAFQKIDITKDKDNFLWILQTTKAQRYDGRNAVDFSFNERLVSILCDLKGVVWVTTETNVYRFINDRKEFEAVSVAGQKQDTVGKIFQLKDRPVWLQTSDGFFEYDDKYNLFKRVLADVPLTNNITRRNFAFFKWVLFFQNGDTLYSYDLTTKQIKSLPRKPGVDLLPVSESKLLSTSWEYITYWFDFEKKQIQPVMSPVQQQNSRSSFLYVRDLKQLDENRFIIGARNGIFEYALKENTYKKLNFYHKGRLMTNAYTIVRIYIDADKKVWFGLRDGIVHYDHFRDVIALKRNNEHDKMNTWTDAVTNFAEDEKGNIWFGGGNGFAYWDLTKDIITSFPSVQGATDRLSQLSVRGIAYDGKYVILGPTDQGFWLFDPLRKTYKRPGYPPGDEGKKVKQASEGDFVDQIRTLHNGDHIIVGRDALYRLNGKTYELTIFDCPPGKENANFVRQDWQKRIWIGSNKGLHCLDSGLNYLFNINELKDNALRSFCEWNKDEILVSGRGIYSIKIENNKIHTSRFHSFFNEINVNLIYKDRAGKLWAGTDQGLYRIDSATREIELFDYADNVQGNGFNYDASFLSSRNILFLGGVNGLNYFIPEKIPSLNHLLKVSIQKLRVNEDDSGYTHTASAFSLRYNQRSMEVSFVAPYYFNAGKVRYRYMLEGFAEEWKNIGGNNSVLFTSLPSGNYVFRVAASIDGTHWHESEDTIKFSIELPFWKTWWFISLVAVVAAVSIYTLYRYQLNKKLEVERFRLRVSRDLHDDIGSTLSSINILCKSSSSDEIENGHNNKSLLEKIQQRSQKTLDAMDDLVWNTKPGNESLESLIIRMREYAAEILEAAGIGFTLASPEVLNNIKLNMQQRKNLFLIFKEAINNLAKYSKTKKASIRFEQEKKYLRMVIIDEGTGFTMASIKKGNGLDNMQSRAAEMNAQLEIHSSESKGTTISVEMPV